MHRFCRDLIAPIVTAILLAACGADHNAPPKLDLPAPWRTTTAYPEADRVSALTPAGIEAVWVCTSSRRACAGGARLLLAKVAVDASMGDVTDRSMTSLVADIIRTTEPAKKRAPVLETVRVTSSGRTIGTVVEREVYAQDWTAIASASEVRGHTRWIYVLQLRGGDNAKARQLLRALLTSPT